MDEIEQFAKGFHTSEDVTISLEGVQQTFTIKANLLQQASQYFKKALAGEFSEAKSQTLRLPGCELDVFKVFLYWLHTSKLPLPDKKLSPIQNQALLIRTWVFADGHLLPKLQNEVMKRLICAPHAYLMQPAAVQLAISLTTAKSNLQTAVVTKAMNDSMRDLVKSPDFVTALTNVLLHGEVSDGDSRAFDVSEYSGTYMVPE